MTQAEPDEDAYDDGLYDDDAVLRGHNSPTLKLRYRKPKHPWLLDPAKAKKYQIARRKLWLTFYRWGEEPDFSEFTRFPHNVIRSRAMNRRLNDSEFRLLVYMAARFDGYNNGELTATPTEVERHLGWSRSRLHRALKGLLEKGALKQTAKAVGVLPALYAVAFYRNMPKRNARHADRNE